MPPSPVPSSPSSSENPGFGYYFQPVTEQTMPGSMDSLYRQHTQDGTSKYPASWPHTRFSQPLPGQDFRPTDSHSPDGTPLSIMPSGDTSVNTGFESFDKIAYPAHGRDSYENISRAMTGIPSSRPRGGQYVHGLPTDSSFPTAPYLTPQSRRPADAQFSGMEHVHSRAPLSGRTSLDGSPAGGVNMHSVPNLAPEPRIPGAQGSESFLSLLESSETAPSIYGGHPPHNGGDNTVPTLRIHHAGDPPPFDNRW
jgi:hypothetical protein